MERTAIKNEVITSADGLTKNTEKLKVDSSAVAASQQAFPETTVPPPPSNLKACLQCLGAFFLFFNSWGLVNAFGAYQAFYEKNLLQTHTASQISWIGSLQAYLFLAGGVVAGPLYDRGHLKLLVGLGSFLVVFGMMMASICSVYWQTILAQGLVVGIGNGCLFVPSTAIIPPYFTKRRALAMGIAITGGNIGGVIYSSVFERLQPSIGFPWATRVIAFIQIVTLVTPVFVLEMRYKPAEARPLYDNTAWKDPRFSIFSCACLLGYIGLYIPYFYANSFALSNKVVSAHLAVYLVAILNAGSFFGRIVSPIPMIFSPFIPNSFYTLTYAADRVGPLNMLLVCFVGSAILAFGWIGVHSTAGTIIFCLLYGAFSGALISLVLTVIAAKLCPDLTSLGVRIGMVCVFCSIGILVGSPLGGILLRDGWVSLQSFAGAMLTAGAVGILIIRYLTVGFSFRVKT